MCYRCGFCSAVVPDGVPRRVYTEYRIKPIQKTVKLTFYDSKGLPQSHYVNEASNHREIHRETPACSLCLSSMNSEGLSPTELRERLEKERKKLEAKADLLTLPIRKGRKRLAAPLLTEEDFGEDVA